jgi:hypothetical protein
MSGLSRFGQLTSAQTGEIERRLQALEKRLNLAGARASNGRDIVGDLGDWLLRRYPAGRTDSAKVQVRSAINQRLSAKMPRGLGQSPLIGSETKVDSGRWLRLRSPWAWGFSSVWPYGHRQDRGDDTMNKNRVERTSANDLTGQLQENASELVRSVGDVAGKFIKEQPYTATLIAFGIGWLLGRTHRPL